MKARSTSDNGTQNANEQLIKSQNPMLFESSTPSTPGASCNRYWYLSTDLLASVLTVALISVVEEVTVSNCLLSPHIEAYFEYIYSTAVHGFLHKGTLLQELDEGRAPEIVLKAIAVAAAPFVAPPLERIQHTAQWSSDVDAYITKNMGTFSMLNLKVLTLWTNHHHFNGHLERTWMLLGLAARLAYCLQINVESKCI